MAIAFVSFSSGTSGRNIEIVSGTTLLVVGVCRNDAVGSGTTASLGATTLDVANNANDWTQVHYIIDPPVGTAAVAATGTNITNVFAAHYSGDLSFVSAAQGSVSSHSFSPTDPALMVFAQSSSSTSHTPLTNNTERYDVSGDYFCDRIEASGGTYSVGVSSSTDPDSTAALFTEASGASLTATAAFTAQSASSAATVLRARSVDAAFTAQAATAAATAVLGHPTSATFTAQSATMAATGTVTGNKTATASFAAQAASAAVTASHGLPASAAFQAQAAASATTASVVGTKTLTAAFAAQSATMAATANVPHLPGTATPRVTSAGSSAVATSDPIALADAAGSSSVSTSSPTAAVQAGRGSSSVIG